MKSKPIKCNGIVVGAPAYSPIAVDFLTFVINQVRTRYELGSCEIRGARFNSDHAVLLRMSSHATEAEAMREPLSWAYAALQDCAHADAYYAAKDWELGREPVLANDDVDHGGEA